MPMPTVPDKTDPCPNADNEFVQWQDMIKTIRRRGERLEMTFMHAEGLDERSRCSVEILALTGDEGLIVTAPEDEQVAARYQQQCIVELIAAGKQQRWRACCVLEQIRDHVGESTGPIPAFRFAAPHALASGQRRTYYRVHIPMNDQPPAVIRAGSTEPATRTRRVRAQLANVSGSGLGFLIDPKMQNHEWIKSILGQRNVVCSLLRPDADEDLVVPSEVVHVEAVHGGLLYVGVKVHHPDPTELARLEDHMLRLVISVERQQLRGDRTRLSSERRSMPRK